MSLSRRRFVQSTLGATALSVLAAKTSAAETPRPTFAQLDAAAARPVLDVSSLKSPVKIASMELLRNGKNFVVRVRTTDGAEGLAIPNADRLIDTYPVFLRNVAPFFIGKDARELEALEWELYRHNSNYKLQGIALWSCHAAAEFAILDLLGKLSGKSIGNLLGGVKRREIAVYRASGNRGNTPQAEIEYLQKLLDETGAKAFKYRLGGRMSKNADSLPGRSETLIPLVRKTFGDDIALYADSNSSYDAAHAIPIGKMMQDHGYGFFEEPCEFDDFVGTKAVADALTMPVAGGEQEFSEWRFRTMIHDRVVDVVQPDLHYYGGFIRAMRVARMAEVAGMPCTLHMSGSGMGHMDVVHFASCCPDPGPFQEFKGDGTIPVHSDTSSLKCEKGIVRVPTGPGMGYTIDPAWIAKAQPVTTF